MNYHTESNRKVDKGDTKQAEVGIPTGGCRILHGIEGRA